MGQQRRQFSPEFKADAVALVRTAGFDLIGQIRAVAADMEQVEAQLLAVRASKWGPIAAIAHELGVGESNLSYWLKKDRESCTTADPGRFETESAEARENAALRRRVAELEVEREILKRATAFWVKESRA